MDNLHTLDDVYRKFGEVAEAAQLLETELGTLQLFYGVVQEGIITETLQADGERAAALLERINHQTLGQLIRRTTGMTDSLDQVESLLTAALKERNRLSHSFYRHHNFRRNSPEGRAIMMEDLESIHKTLLDAFKALSRLSGIDLDALVVEIAKKEEGTKGKPSEESLYFHLPL